MEECYISDEAPWKESSSIIESVIIQEGITSVGNYAFHDYAALKNVTIPMVMPSITICTFLTLSNSFKLFDQNLALTAGAPAKQTEMLALDIYNTFYGRAGNEGVGQAKAVLFFVLVAVIALGQLAITRRREVEA